MEGLREQLEAKALELYQSGLREDELFDSVWAWYVDYDPKLNAEGEGADAQEAYANEQFMEVQLICASLRV
jgi:hypothetical protein